MASPSPDNPLGGVIRYRLPLLLSAALFTSLVAAAPVPMERIQQLASGIASKVHVSYASGAAVSIAQAVSPVEVKVSAVAPTNSDETVFYVVDRGSVGGFVVMSADDRLDPVLVIAPTGYFDATPGSPLYDILCSDVQKRVVAAERGGLGRSEQWANLLESDDSVDSSIVYAGISSISDVRVEPIVQSKWNQSTVGRKNVYNYYTPNNFVCGCVATAGAQIMRHHKHPDGSVIPVTRTCYVSGVAVDKTMYGGVYSWNDMPLVPASSITDTQCKAIGKLCYDLGVAIYMGWSSGGSGTGGYCLKDAFLDVFGYKNAIAWQLRDGTLSSTAIENILLANFDAGYPVELSIDGPYGGHSIVGDGYGYSEGHLYVHLNLGWGGSDDAWYNLPNIGTGYEFNCVDGAVYNIFPDGTGDLVTGRVYDSNGNPVSGATVQAYNGSTIAGTATTSESGIYALRLPGGVTYTVAASASGSERSTITVYLQKSVTTVTSGRYYYIGTGTIGNSWGNDFTLTMASEPVAPDVPVNVSAEDGTSTSRVRVRWSASSGATYYKVYRSVSNSSSSANLLASSVTSLYYDDVTAVAGTTYYYWIIAGNSSGESGFSAADSGWRAYTVPNAPTGVTATDGTSTIGVTVSWNAVDSAVSYSVWRSSTSSSASAVSIAANLTATSYTDTSAQAGQVYYYWVKAVSKGGTSPFSSSDSGYRAIAAPSAPTGVSASDGTSSSEIVITWNAAESASSYSVWRASSSSTSAAKQIAQGVSATSYSDTSAVAGTTYYYWVRSSNSGGTSSFGSYDTGYLAVITGPSSVTASDGAYAGYVNVSWNSSQNATSYELWRGTANAYSQASRIASLKSTTYKDTATQQGTLYYYWVRAVTTAGTSAFSSSDSGYRPISSPTGVSATTGNADGVKVSWAAVTGAVSYQIGRGEKGASSPSSVLGSSTSLYYMDSTAVPGVEYAYFVRGVASACIGGWSSPATGARSVPTPTGLSATDGTYSDRIVISWPALSGALSYELMRSSENDIAFAETIATTTSASYSDRAAEYGLTYYYWIRAKFSAGTSPWSASEAGWRAFPAPTGVSATDGENTGRITISWNAIEGALLFQVWRYSNERGRNELLGTSATTSYNDSRDIEPGKRYSYRIKAIFATGSSAFSNADSGYLKSTSPTVAATDGTSTSQISLTWNESPGAVTYLVYRGTTSSVAGAVQIGSTSMLYYNDATASKGTLYYYWVRTVSAIDTSDFGAADTGYVGLPGVARVTATDGTYADKVAVSWSAVSGAKTYEVWRGASDESSSAVRVKNGVTSLSWEDTGVTPGVRSWYWVRACDVGVGQWGTSDSGYRILTAPADVTATTNQTDGVKVSWKGVTSGVYFEIRRGVTDDPGAADTIATIANTANYTDNTAVPGYVYYYWVRAYSDLSESVWSPPARGFRAVAFPLTVVATDGTSLDSITVTWPAATSAKRYEIWRSTTSAATAAELIGTTNKLTWVDGDVEQGRIYYYWVRSVSAIDTSAFGARDSGYVSTPPPTGVTATDGTSYDCVRVTWDKSEGAASYAVWRAESENAETAAEIRNGLTSTVYDDTTAVPGKFYWYWVRPVSVAGKGVFAGPDSGFRSLAAPTGVLATSNNVAHVTVSWQRSNGATSYEIFRAATNDLAFATNGVLATVATTAYNDTNAVPAVKYWYWVRARADADKSSMGGPADGFRLLSAPAGVTASDGGFDAYVKVNWNEVTGAASYELWRAENSTATSAATLIAGVTNALEYIDRDATPGIPYTYWVKAVSDLHTTAFSGYDKGWRSPLAPESVMASDGTTADGVVVEWSAVDGAVKYEVWRNAGENADTNGATRVFTSNDALTSVYTNANAVAGIKYWFWVRTVSAAGTGVYSLPDDGFRAVAAPVNLKAADGASYDNVRVTWSAASGATSYEVCRSRTDDLSQATNELFTVTSTTFDDTNALHGVIYNYWVRSVTSLDKSAFAGSDTGYRKLPKVGDVSASDGTSLEAVEISWTSLGGAAEYQIWRATGTSIGSATKIATVDGTEYSDSTALHGVRYYYWVRAVADVEGEYGNYNDGWRGLQPPATVSVTDGDSTSHARIAWSSSPDATTYEIMRGTSADAGSMTSLRTVAASANLVWEDTTAVAGTVYYYCVRAGGTGGWSAPGPADSGYKALMAPTSVTATDGTLSRKVTVSWKAVTGATHYRVYRAAGDGEEKTPLSGWQTELSFTDVACSGETRYWYYAVAATDAAGARPSVFSAGDSGYAKDDGAETPKVDFGGGITWPVTQNANGSVTTNAIVYSSVSGGKLKFSGVSGSVGSSTTVHVLVKTSLASGKVYTVSAPLKIVSSGTGEIDISAVWGTKESLFVIGISAEAGEALP